MSRWGYLEEGTKEALKGFHRTCSRWACGMVEMVGIDGHPSEWVSDDGMPIGATAYHPIVSMSAPVFVALMDELEARNAEIEVLRMGL